MSANRPMASRQRPFCSAPYKSTKSANATTEIMVPTMRKILDAKLGGAIQGTVPTLQPHQPFESGPCAFRKVYILGEAIDK